MNTPSALLRRCASLVLTLTLSCALSACAATAPARESRSEIAVEIIRDDWGVPHIFSDSEEGGYYGFGYAYAEDRLQRLIGMVLLARGELSSFLGPGQLQTDITARQWRALEMARASVDRLDPQLRRNYLAFIAGVQAYAARPETPAPLARAASTLELADIVAVPRALLYLGYQVPAALAECRLNGMTYSEAMLPYQSSAEGPASNGWVVAPQRTAAGGTIVASDPHVENENLAYYEYHIDAGRLHSSGYAIGAALWQAHNENVAWSFTTGAPDVLDCYAVQTDPANPRRFLYDGHWLEMESRTETINVTGAEPVTRTFEYTRHNGVLSPVVARVGDIAYVVSAADMDRVAELNNEFYRMNLARSVDGLRAALSTMSMFPQNISAGDRAGHTLYLRAGRAPRRPSGYDFTRPVPGNTSATAWRGVHALRDLVQMESPSSGYFQNNNVAPDVMIEGGAAGSLTRYAPDLFNDTPGRQTTRGARALQWLSSHPSMTLEDATALMEDETWITARGWIEALSYAIETRPQTFAHLSAPAQAAAARLLHFDGVARADSEAAADFLLWRNAAANDVIALDDGAFVTWPWRREQLTPALADVLLQAMSASVEARTAAYGDRAIRLGDLFSVRRGGVQAPIGGVSIETPRIPLCLERVRSVCERTMRAFGAAPDGANRFRVVRGSQAMRLVQFTAPLRAYSAYAFGQSDDPNSPHYADQIALFAGARMKPAYFSRAELEGHISARQQLRYTDQDQHAH